jgi:uncharacterized membrane protein
VGKKSKAAATGASVAGAASKYLGDRALSVGKAIISIPIKALSSRIVVLRALRVTQSKSRISSYSKKVGVEICHHGSITSTTIFK